MESTKAMERKKTSGISPVTPAGGYRVEGAVNGIPTSFLLDTGAAVTLLRQDTWETITANCPQDLKNWSALRLVSADGSPLTIHGSAQVLIDLGGGNRETEVVVVSPLTTEAIIGLDFLKDHKAQIDLPNKKLYLRGSQAIPLQEQSECIAIPCRRVKVRTKRTTRLPPRSEMEVLACLDEAVEQGTWMLEQALDKNLPAVIARALVRTGTHQVPIRLLNPGAEEITIYAGTQIANIERVEILQSISTVSNDESPTATAEEQAALWGSVENLEHEHVKTRIGSSTYF